MTGENTDSSKFRGNVFWMGVYLVVLGFLLGYLLVSVWPPEWPMDQRSTAAQPGATTETADPDAAERPAESALTAQPSTEGPTDEPQTRGETIGLLWGWFTFPDTPDLRLILVVLVMGAIGSYVHVVASFVYFVGREQFSTHWFWWYLLRPFIGMALALVFYLVVRGGFLAADGNNLNLYGAAAIAGLVGLSSKQATERLKRLFNTLFGVTDEDTSPEAKPGEDKPPPAGRQSARK
jgi:hypothetical protein